jgi:hypothetical protein
MSIPARVACLALSLLIVPFAHAASLLPAEPVPLDSLTAFRDVTGNWQLAGGLAGDPRREKTLTGTAGTGLLVNQPAAGGKNGPLLTAWEHGDLDLSLDFLVPPGSNSGVYLQGRYEVQILDSFGKKKIGMGDLGALYSAAVPKLNAAKAPGEWQKFVIDFQAPKFDGDKKTANAKFLKVTLNGEVLHESVEMKQQTPGGLTGKEHATGPLMFQGDHGAVAFRSVKVTPK